MVERADEELLEPMRLCRRAVAAQRGAMRADGCNVGVNLGRVAGAGPADHLHRHVVPRWHGDTDFMPVLADTHVISQALEAAEARDEPDGPEADSRLCALVLTGGRPPPEEPIGRPGTMADNGARER